jgi:hypothetical protein
MTGSVGVVGDFNPKNRNHLLTNAAFGHVGLPFDWVPTDTIGDEPKKQLAAYDGFLIAPASPYRSMHGRSRPFGMRVSEACLSSPPEAASSTRSSSSRATFSGSGTPATPRRALTPNGWSSRPSPARWLGRRGR